MVPLLVQRQIQRRKAVIGAMPGLYAKLAAALGAAPAAAGQPLQLH